MPMLMPTTTMEERGLRPWTTQANIAYLIAGGRLAGVSCAAGCGELWQEPSEWVEGLHRELLRALRQEARVPAARAGALMGSGPLASLSQLDRELAEAAALADLIERRNDELRLACAEYLAGRELEMPDPAQTYFPSGSNKPGEIRGLLAAAENVGVAAHQVSGPAEEELHALAGYCCNVFVDSGAFSEVNFASGRPEVVAPIGEAEWAERLGLYARLARSLRGQLWCVAPDMVAFQAETLQRIARWAREMRAIRATCANVIVPIQKGALSMAAFDRAAGEILGFSYVRGIPMKKDATKLSELVAFLQERQPRAIHLLGFGIYSRGYARVIKACLEARPGLLITCDSARIPALVGWGADGKTPRLYTKHRAALAASGLFVGVGAVCEEATRRSFQDETREREAELRCAGWYDQELFSSWEESQRAAGLPTAKPASKARARSPRARKGTAGASKGKADPERRAA